MDDMEKELHAYLAAVVEDEDDTVTLGELQERVEQTVKAHSPVPHPFYGGSAQICAECSVKAVGTGGWVYMFPHPCKTVRLLEGVGR